MICINEYINEKLVIDKSVQSVNKKKQEINDKFISALTNFLQNNHEIKIGKYPDTISVCGKNNDFILLTLSKDKRYLYKKLMQFIDEFYSVRKKCSTNNQSIYIYPNYEENK